MTGRARTRLAHRGRRLSALDIPGGGQVVVQGGYAYVGHMRPPYGTSIIDVTDKRNPRIVGEIRLDGEASHTHKVRVVGDLMYTNVEQNDRHAKRRARDLAQAETALAAELGRPPTDAEIANRLGVVAGEIAKLRGAPEIGRAHV